MNSTKWKSTAGMNTAIDEKLPDMEEVKTTTENAATKVDKLVVRTNKLTWKPDKLAAITAEPVSGVEEQAGMTGRPVGKNYDPPLSNDDDAGNLCCKKACSDCTEVITSTPVHGKDILQFTVNSHDLSDISHYGQQIFTSYPTSQGGTLTGDTRIETNVMSRLVQEKVESAEVHETEALKNENEIPLRLPGVIYIC